MRLKEQQNKKRTYGIWIGFILVDIAAILFIPLNLYVVHFPEWVCLPVSLVVMGECVYLWRREALRYGKKILLTLFMLVMIVISWMGSYCNPYWNSISFFPNPNYFSKDYDDVISREEAMEDLEFAMRYLKKVHPAMYHGLTEDVQQRYEAVTAELLTRDTVGVNEFAVWMQSILSVIGDGHTVAYTNFRDWKYMKYIDKHNRAGDELVMVNGLTMEQLFNEHKDKFSFDTSSYGMKQLKNSLNTLQDLDYLGISAEDGVVYTYQTPEGTLVEQFVTEEDFLSWEEYEAYNQVENDTEQAAEFVWYEIDEENSLALLTLTQCNYNEEYRQCLDEMFAEVEARNIENVAVDLRQNGGGNSLVADEFIHYLDVDSYKSWACNWRLGYLMIEHEQMVLDNKTKKNKFDGNVYILTSVNTFSSAMDFAMLIKDNQLGTIIGEAPGNDPNSYGDISTFKLPNSQLIMSISTKQWYRIDKKEGLIEPDIACDGNEAMDYLYDAITDAVTNAVTKND